MRWHSKVHWANVVVVTMPYFLAINQPLLRYCDLTVWTTHEEYLVVFVTVQNLVEIGEWFR